MSINRKILAAGAAVAGLAAVAAYAIADSGHGRGGMQHERGMGKGGGMGGGMMGRRGGGMGQMEHQDPVAQLAKAKSELAITAAQSATWDAYAKVVTDVSSERRKVREGVDRDAVRNMKPEDRQSFRDSMMKQRDEARAKVKAAAETVVAVLDDAQKAKAQTLLPGLKDSPEQHGRGPGMGRGEGRGHGMGHGKGPRI